MPTIRNTVTINATPDEVWAVLADLPATRMWLPGVVAARMDGDLRVCATADGQEIHERISDLSPESRSYRIHHVRVPLPVRHSGGMFTVAARTDPGTAVVTLQPSFEPLDSAGSYSDAEEAVQEVLIRAWRGLSGYRGTGPLRHWLYRITTTTCLKMI